MCPASRYIIDERSYENLLRINLLLSHPLPLCLQAHISFSHGVERDLIASGGGGELINPFAEILVQRLGVRFCQLFSRNT
jgi:hypothetical protein